MPTGLVVERILVGSRQRNQGVYLQKRNLPEGALVELLAPRRGAGSVQG